MTGTYCPDCGQPMRLHTAKAGCPERPGQRRRRNEGTRMPFIGPMEKYPPEPRMYHDDHGRFHYMDYDGESLTIWRDKNGELWVDKHGQGPVYVRPEHAVIIAQEILRKAP